MTIPPKPIGSIPRPLRLIEVVAAAARRQAHRRMRSTDF
jgi:hypothetical protein